MTTEFMKHSPRHPYLSTLVLASVALVSPLFSSSAHANLITNGDFESSVIFNSGDGLGGVTSSGAVTDTKVGDLAGWDTGPSSNGPNAFGSNSQSYFTLGAGGGPHGGALAAVFPNTPTFDGYISQIATTVIGQWYTVGFWVSNQVGDPGDINNHMIVNWGGTIVNPGDAVTLGESISVGSLPGAIPVPTGWTHYEFTRQSVGNDSRISFIGGSTPGALLIDDVTVLDAVPEVSSFGMITGLALLAFGTASRIRRRQLATA